jgi:DNA-binding IclR family transcriptional regulator
MDINALSSMLGQELANECAQDQPQQEDEFTTQELADALGVHRSSAGVKLRQMVASGALTMRGASKKYYKRTK